eukprot:845608-Prymnesium_polylepis.1
MAIAAQHLGRPFSTFALPSHRVVKLAMPHSAHYMWRSPCVGARLLTTCQRASIFIRNGCI